MQKSEVLFILKSFFVWRVLIFVPILLAPFFFELQKNFLGGGLINYLSNPLFWSWANFDGDHYWNIAKIGYGNGEQAFFPVYPLILRLIGDIFSFNSPSLLIWTGMITSNIYFLIALFGLHKLLKLDYKERTIRIIIILILVFPASFFFGSVYNESLFLSLIVWSFYFLRKEKYLLAGILGGISSATRVIGITLLPAFVFSINIFKQFSKFLILLITIPVGLISYMSYSHFFWYDPIKFFHASTGFGEQRSNHLIILPQVFYRYVFKIIPNLNWDYFPIVFTTLLEFSVAVLFLCIIVFSFKKITLDYWIYLTLGYLVPTLSGSFSSLPRYVLVLFPGFIFLSLILEKLNKYMRIGIFIILSIIAATAHMLFVRGYFIS